MQVHDVKMQNEYNLRLKDAALNNHVRELTGKHAADMLTAEAQRSVLQAELEAQRGHYDERLHEAAEHQQVLH
jgi:hypothetical protein